MKVHPTLESYNGTNAHVTMGVFDGVHSGHVSLLHRLKEMAKSDNKESVALTFWPHPRLVLNQDADELHLLTTLEEKIEIISSTGIDHLILIKFDETLASYTAEDFIKQVLVNKLKVSHLLIGYNHRFGKDGAGFEQVMKFSLQYGFGLSQFRHISIGDQYPSSTKIRGLMMAGNIIGANSLLGYPYTIKGVVSGGMKLGRTLDYPTANLVISENTKLIPPNGVYACKVKLRGETYNSMVYIGIRPTINSQHVKRSVEVHLLDFKDDIYSETITVEFISKTRDEIKFPDILSLKEQLKIDETRIRFVLSN